MRDSKPEWWALTAAGLGIALACTREDRSDEGSAGSGSNVVAGTTANNNGVSGLGGTGTVQGGTTGVGGVGELVANAQFLWSQSGTRLQVRLLVSDDGFKVPYDIYDSELGMSCRPTRMADDEWRCLQPVTYVQHTMFVDDECTQAVVTGLRGPFEPMPGDLAYTGAFGCGGLPGPDQLFLVGEEVPPPQQLYEFNETSTCVASSLSGWNKTCAASPLPAGDLVSFSGEETAVSARISAPVWVGDDGSRISESRPDGIHDLERDTTVKVYDVSSAFRLLPSMEPVGVVCSDPACGAQPAAPGGPTQAAPFFLLDSSECSDSSADGISYMTWNPHSVYAVGTYRVEAGETTINIPGGGSSPGTSKTVAGLQAVESIPLDAWLPALPFEASGRYSLYTGFAADGLALSQDTTALVDHELAGLLCRVRRAADGQLRCLPSDGYGLSGRAVFPPVPASVGYADEACSDPIALYQSGITGVGGSSAVGPEIPQFALPNTRRGEDPVTVYRLGEAINSRQYYAKDAEHGCQPYEVQAGMVIAKATEVPPETFGRFVIETL